MMDSSRVRSAEDVAEVLQRLKPGDALRVVYADRAGVEKTTTVTVADDPHVEVRPLEATGGTVSAAQRKFRDQWLSGR
jgi:hypothetical protein